MQSYADSALRSPSKGALGNLPQKAAHLLILYSKVRYAKVLATAFGPFALVHKKFPSSGNFLWS